MRLYSGITCNFIQDSIQNQIAEKLRTAFFDYYGFNPSHSEIMSWRNSLRAMSQVLQHSDLYDQGVMLEYQLPLSSKRLDCLFTGKNHEGEDSAVIVELKQWDKVEESDSPNEVVAWVGGLKRDVLHPSAQVGCYHNYLKDVQTAFYDESDPIQLNSCSYLHNYNYYEDDHIFSTKFSSLLQQFPLFTADHIDPLSEYLKQRLNKGEGIDVLNRIEKSRYKPSKKLMDHVGKLIKGNSDFILLDEQLIVYDKVLTCAQKSFHDKQKVVIIVKGGPGTGKSIIAINLMADLLLKNFNAHYATGSKAFTQTLRNIIGSRGSTQFKYFNSYSAAKSNEIDVIISDEAHRIRITSNSRFTPKTKKSNKIQIEELIDAAKVSVFFIDDYQVVRPNEIGSSKYIRDYAISKGCKIYDYELEIQFRCNGSEAFINWINNTLDIHRTANVLWESNETFDFRIFDTPESLEEAIREKYNHKYTARMSAGFCWPWSEPLKDGSLVNDVVVGDFARPWNAKSESGRLAPGIPKESLWAYDPRGINQIGCIYTAQGFEFDYIGIIFGKDLKYDFDKQRWVGQSQYSFDSVVKKSKDKFVDLVKNTYRVLLSRGMKGCYVHFMDKETERFFKSRLVKQQDVQDESLQSSLVFSSPSASVPKIEVSVDQKSQYRAYLPVYSLQAAATSFGRDEYVEQTGWIRVQSGRQLNKNMFVCKVAGKSMEPTIPDGSYCVFQFDKGGSRNDKVVLVESRRVADPETNQKFTVKRYSSEKELFEDGTWRHKKIVLSPDNPAFEKIILENVFVEDFRVIAEFVSVV